jgi:hypothetical protein
MNAILSATLLICSIAVSASTDQLFYAAPAENSPVPGLTHPDGFVEWVCHSLEEAVYITNTHRQYTIQLLQIVHALCKKNNAKIHGCFARREIYRTCRVYAHLQTATGYVDGQLTGDLYNSVPVSEYLVKKVSNALSTLIANEWGDYLRPRGLFLSIEQYDADAFHPGSAFSIITLDIQTLELRKQHKL